MEYRQLGGSGFKVPALSLGTGAQADIRLGASFNCPMPWPSGLPHCPPATGPRLARASRPFSFWPGSRSSRAGFMFWR